MKRILVIQLARLGDILQTLPTLAGLKKAHPDSRITLIVRETFADAAHLSPDVDELIVFPSRHILSPTLQEPGNDHEKARSLAHLITWIADTVLENTHANGPFDLTLNLTFSEASSYLCELIPSKERRGLHRAKDGAYAVTDPWSHYFYSQVLRKNLNIIHINDLFARIAGVAATPVELVHQGFDSSQNQNLGTLCIGIQLGASQSNKTLNPKTWGMIAQGLLEALPEAHLVLFGGRSDKKQAQAVMAQLQSSLKERCTNLVGRLRYYDNIPWIKRCKFVITPDTAMVHLAPLCGITTINLSVGNVRAEETGPYGNGHYVLRPLESTFEEGVKPINEVLLALIMNEQVSSHLPTYKTKLVECSDGTLRNILVSMNCERDEILNFFEQSYYLLAEFRNSGRQEDIAIPKLGSPEHADRIQHLITAYDALCALKQTAEFGRNYCLKMLTQKDNKEELLILSQQLTELEAILASLQKSVLYVKPLIDSWEVSKENVIGHGVEELASMTEGTFRELVQNVDMVQQLLQIAVDEAQKNIIESKGPQSTVAQTLKESEHENSTN